MRFAEIISNFVIVGKPTYILKVFSQSLSENVVVFKAIGDGQHSFIRIDHDVRTFWPRYFISIRVWSIE